MTRKNKEKIIIYGASGHAKVVVDILERQNCYEIGFMIDDDPRLKGSNFFGYHVVGGMGDLLREASPGMKVIVAIGDNVLRKRVFSSLKDKGFKFPTAIHPSCQLAKGVVLGAGTVAMAQVVINPDTQIGKNVILNTMVSIDHDCNVGDGTHIAPGATLCGAVNVGEGTLIGAGATVLPNIKIGRKVLVGAGSVVINDIPDGMKVCGVPVRP